MIAGFIKNCISVFCPHTALDRKINEYVLKKLNNSEDGFRLDGLNAINKNTLSIEDVVRKCKELTKQSNLRLVLGKNHSMHSVPSEIAVGVGSAFKSIPMEDGLIVSGEMGHHTMLEAFEMNTSVVLLEHGNSERIFIEQLRSDLQVIMSEFKILISESDKDPVNII